MVTIEELAELLNREITEKFIEELNENWKEGDQPIDPESPEIEKVLENIVDAINDTFPIRDDYV